METTESFSQVFDKTSIPSNNDKFNDDSTGIFEKESKAVSVDNSSTRSAPESKSRPTPPPSGTSSKSVPKIHSHHHHHHHHHQQQQQQQSTLSIEKMFETFHQASNGDFKPSFYNPFEVRHRRRTSRSQFKILERAFLENCKPTGPMRKRLADELNMSVRSIQVWFQNRRAKLKSMLKNGKMTDAQMIEYLKNQKQQGEGKDSESTQDSPSSFEDSDSTDSEIHSEVPLPKNEMGKSTCFNSQKRVFPSTGVHEPPAIVCNPDMMSYGNSYPNQVRNRSYSLPAIQRSPQLPFKQLQEALFGQPSQTQIQHPGGPVSLNAFQHYLRASSAAMSQVGHNAALLDVHNSAGNYCPVPPQIIAVPQLNNFTPLNGYNESHQVDSNRFRPRSNSLTVSASNSRSSNSNSSFSEDVLTMIKEDSPISEYMNLSNSFVGHHSRGYYDEGETEMFSNQVDSLDLDYFMAANGPGYHGHGHVGYTSSNPHSNSHSHGSSSILHSSSIPESPMTSTSNTRDTNLNVHNYMNELDFLPQPTNEILLSTLIGDEHFLQ